MRHLFTIIVILLLTTAKSFAQVEFVKGYYIDKQGNTVNCFIKDAGWRYSPSSFDYKITEDGAVQTMKTADVEEFSIGDQRFFKGDNNLLLREIIGGKANLYQYRTKDQSSFFFRTGGNAIEQLLPDTYLAKLNEEVKCLSQPTLTEKDVKLTLKSLADQFRFFNTCTGGTAVEPAKKKVLSIRLTPGVDFTSVTATGPARNYDFGSKTSFRFGVEFQFRLPFQYGKWQVIAEPTLQSFKGDNKPDPQVTIQDRGEISITSFNVPVGIRHRFFFKNRNSFYLNAAVVADIPLEHRHTLVTGNFKREFKVLTLVPGSMLGGGFTFGKLSIEGRYYPQWTRSHDDFVYTYNRTSILLGFKIH